MASTKFEVSMEIFKFQGEPDVSVTLTGKSPAELDTALKTLETIAKTTTLYNGDSAPEAHFLSSHSADTSPSLQKSFARRRRNASRMSAKAVSQVAQTISKPGIQNRPAL